MKRDDVYFEAMRTRDRRFDGKFFVGVKTTGIYCRPLCPAKPKRENVEFFANRFEAEKAGYRPCLRCRPESAPQSKAWIGTSALVQRAVRVLHDRHALELNEDKFAALFGVTARHLRRLFMQEIGKTPKQLSFENRLNLARQLLSETRLPISEVAFASGFHSIRRFNDAFKLRFQRSPGQIRRVRGVDGKKLSVSIAYRPPFDFRGILRFYESHRVGDLEIFEDGCMLRMLEFDGKVGWVRISDEPEQCRLRVEIDFPDNSVIHSVILRVRNLFDLDSDPLVVANALERNPKMTKLMSKHRGLRVPTGWDPFETAIACILGQGVRIDQGRRLVHDLIESVGRDSGVSREGKNIFLFPHPGDFTLAKLKKLKTTESRRKALITFAQMVDQGEISLEPTQDVELFKEKIQSIPGLGPWTAEVMAMKVLRDTDAFPATDLILARALAKHSLKTIEQMGPWRAYVATLFWREYAPVLSKSERKSL